jgi:hypothetical protein
VNRSEIRDWVFRRLNAVSDVDFQVADVNRMIDLAATMLKGEIVKWKPTEAIRIWRINIATDATTGKRDQYIFPTHGEIAVRVLDGSVTPSRYRKADYYDPTQHETIVNLVAGGTAQLVSQVRPVKYYWTRRGKYLQLVPEPVADVTAGLELEFHTTRVIFGNDNQDADNDWGIELGLQPAIVYKACEMLLPENQEDTTVDQAKYDELVSKIPIFYPAMHGEPIMPQMPHRG